jgi:hypothetical protein
MNQMAPDDDLDFDQLLFVFLFDELLVAELRRRFPGMAEEPS